jgi:hypothetical protein
MIGWIMTISFVISLLWLLLVAPWSLNPRLIPKIQFGFLDFIFRLFWYSRLLAAKAFPLSKLQRPPIGCHRIARNISKLNCDDIKSFDMEIVANFISLPTRPNRSFYFFSGFVLPFLNLDLIGNKSESWNRMYACFNYILNQHKMVLRSEQIANNYAEKLAHSLTLNQERPFKISDERLRYIFCAIMWELVFDSEPSESDLITITKLTQTISTMFTYNLDPDWSKRIDLYLSFMKQIRCHPEMLMLQNNFKLTSQEMCTVVAMELFITPAIEMAEVMSNLMTELAFDNTDLIRKTSCDSDIMRYAIIATAHQYPVFQVMFREISYEEGDKNLTACSNLFHDMHVVEIQPPDIVESIKNESIIDAINRYICNRDHHKSSISEINTCMAFGRGPRICKGKELAIKIITAFLTTFYTELNGWPNVELSAGRKYTAFSSFNHRLYYLSRRCWIADVHYYLDKLFRRSALQRFQCQL